MVIGARFPSTNPLPPVSRWVEGPHARADGAVVVSVTEYAPHRRRDMPGAVRTGLRLRKGWYAMQGAVGIYLWSSLLGERAGSITVWTGEDALRRFVALPAHVEVMRRYRDRGTIRSATWTAERLDRPQLLIAARRWIGGPR